LSDMGFLSQYYVVVGSWSMAHDRKPLKLRM